MPIDSKKENPENIQDYARANLQISSDIMNHRYDRKAHQLKLELGASV